MWSRQGCRRGRGGMGSGEQHQVSDWQSWHLVTNHTLPLYAVACWTWDGGGMGDAQERSQETRCTSHVESQCQYYCVWRIQATKGLNQQRCALWLPRRLNIALNRLQSLSLFVQVCKYTKTLNEKPSLHKPLNHLSPTYSQFPPKQGGLA